MFMEEQNNSATVCTDDAMLILSSLPNVISTAQKRITPLHGYVYNNK